MLGTAQRRSAARWCRFGSARRLWAAVQTNPETGTGQRRPAQDGLVWGVAEGCKCSRGLRLVDLSLSSLGLLGRHDERRSSGL